MRKKLLLSFVAIASAICALAYDFEVEGIYYNVISLQNFTCEVTYKDSDYNSYSGDIVIPTAATCNGNIYSVNSIGKNAFTSCSNLKSVKIPNSVNKIGNYAFSNNSKLSLVEIPNSVTIIGEGSFLSCSKLTSVTIPNSITEIGGAAFYGCYSLTSVVIPNSVTKIGQSAFSDCRNLSSLVVSNSITKIEDYVFYNCNSLTSVEIPKSVTKIGEYAFFECSELKEIISLRVNPPTIYSNTFDGVPKTTTVLKVPNESLENYKSANYWNTFFNIVCLNSEGNDNSGTAQCAQPTIELINGELMATSETEGAVCYISVTSEDVKSTDGGFITLTGVYNVSSYAHAGGYLNSETATAKVVWANPTIEGAGIISMEAKKAVLIRAHNGNVIVSGTERGESIEIYSIEGQSLCTVAADDGQTIIPCYLNKGEIVIIRYGGKAVKILM